jgi:hypothetical protein
MSPGNKVGRRDPGNILIGEYYTGKSSIVGKHRHNLLSFVRIPLSGLTKIYLNKNHLDRTAFGNTLAGTELTLKFH